jgi:hypothetical protein
MSAGACRHAYNHNYEHINNNVNHILYLCCSRLAAGCVNAIPYGTPQQMAPPPPYEMHLQQTGAMVFQGQTPNLQTLQATSQGQQGCLSVNIPDQTQPSGTEEGETCTQEQQNAIVASQGPLGQAVMPQGQHHSAPLTNAMPDKSCAYPPGPGQPVIMLPSSEQAERGDPGEISVAVAGQHPSHDVPLPPPYNSIYP